MLVSNYALRVKMHLGAINLSEMLNNESYAFDIFVQATMTDDLELKDLTKNLSEEFRISPVLIQGIDSYIQNIQEISSGNQDYKC